MYFMSWIDKRIQQRQKLMERNKAVADGAEGLFDDLWKEIAALTKEANDKGLPVGTDGSAYERVVWAAVIPRLGQPTDRRELRINLHKDREEISVSGSSVPLGLSIDVCDDGVICLKHNGRRILIQGAARLILDPFLFPELQPKDNS
jgi:hypothetical protein